MCATKRKRVRKIRELNKLERYIQKMLDGPGSKRYKFWLTSRPIEAFMKGVI
jgi:hypothetical protein